MVLREKLLTIRHRSVGTLNLSNGKIESKRRRGGWEDTRATTAFVQNAAEGEASESDGKSHEGGASESEMKKKAVKWRHRTWYWGGYTQL